VKGLSCRTGPLRSATPQTKTCLWGPRFERSLRDAYNDAPITKTREVWTSADLKLVMKEQWSDPRSGERTVELEEFSRAEPDPALFRAPQGYVVKDVAADLEGVGRQAGRSGELAVDFTEGLANGTIPAVASRFSAHPVPLFRPLPPPPSGPGYNCAVDGAAIFAAGLAFATLSVMSLGSFDILAGGAWAGIAAWVQRAGELVMSLLVADSRGDIRELA
jgi:hypothetical protein